MNNNNTEYFYTTNNLLIGRERVEWRDQVRTSLQRTEGKYQHTQIREDGKKERIFGKKTHCNEMSLYDDMTNLNTH